MSEDARFLFHPSGSVIQVWPISICNTRAEGPVALGVELLGLQSWWVGHGTLHALPFSFKLLTTENQHPSSCRPQTPLSTECRTPAAAARSRATV